MSTTAARLRDMGYTALTHPERIAPYLRKRALGPVRRRATTRALGGLDGQRERLDALREDDFLLIVLDACRYDVLSEAAGELFVDEPTPLKSEGHDTFEYVARCWPGQYPETTYVSGATPVNSDPAETFEDDHLQSLYGDYVPSEHIGEIVDVWSTGWDETLGTCPPDAVVAETLERLDESRLVAHLFQPHAPYIGEVRELGYSGGEDGQPREGRPADAPVWDRARSGVLTQDRLRAAYRSNLDRALTSVCHLISEVRESGDDRRIVLMGDHGEALGEFGVFSHPRVAHPKIRVVPWVEVGDLSRSGQRLAGSLDHRATTPTTGGDVTERLRSLGYI